LQQSRQPWRDFEQCHCCSAVLKLG
jgi:hypothetical protein